MVDSKTVIFNKFKTKEVNNETKIGLIGAGRWGPNVIGAINRINGAKLVKVADANLEALANLKLKFPRLVRLNLHRKYLKMKKSMRWLFVHPLKLMQI